MQGPKAPKNPEKKRPYFYIMREKEIFSSRQEDGTGIQYIYESDGRLINSAQIAGNVTDKEELKLLETVEGFGKLVHSIGIFVETENPEEEIEFIFQIYGKNDLYGGGTNLKTKLKGDGMEYKILLSEYQWTEDDNIPGQIKFIFQTPEIMGKASVKLYLNDGYDAPEQIEDETVNINSEQYSQMVRSSLLSMGNTFRIQKAIQKAKSGKSVTLAYIGGSITQGAGATPIHTECYAYKSWKMFQKKFAIKENVKFIKAGVGGTPSELGMLRFERDVLRENEQPDIIVIEFAVNDEGDETKGDCYESLVRKALKLPWKPAVILLFSVFANDWNLQERLMPVGLRYDLPMVSIKDAVVPQFKNKEKQSITKNQFFYDMFHPSNLGHTIMADCLSYFFERCEETKGLRKNKFVTGIFDEETLERRLLETAVIGNSFESVHLIDKKDSYVGAKIDEGGFVHCDKELQCVEIDDSLMTVPEFPHNWMYNGDSPENAYFEMKISCKALLLIFKDSGETNVGKADVWVDTEYCLCADPHINNWLHCNAVILFNEKETKEHIVRIEIPKEEREKCFTILGFGYVK